MEWKTMTAPQYCRALLINSALGLDWVDEGAWAWWDDTVITPVKINVN